LKQIADQYKLVRTIIIHTVKMKKYNFITWIYKLFTLITATQSANILVFAPMPFKSHFRGFQPLFKELASRGHNLTVVSTFPLKIPTPNYTDIPISVDESILKGYYIHFFFE